MDEYCIDCICTKAGVFWSLHTCVTFSDFFEENSDALAAADAGRADAVLLVVLPQLVDDVGGDPGAGCGQRVAQGDGTAAVVELLIWDLKLFLTSHDLSAESLVDLNLKKFYKSF